MNDKQIRQLAEKSGMWGVDDWWKQEIPRLRKFYELASAQQGERADEAKCTAKYHLALAEKGDTRCGVCGQPLRR